MDHLPTPPLPPNRNALSNVLAKSPACSRTPLWPSANHFPSHLVSCLDSSVRKVLLLFSCNWLSGDFLLQSQPYTNGVSQNNEAMMWRSGALGVMVRFKFWLYSLPATWPFKFSFLKSLSGLLFYCRYDEDNNLDLLDCPHELSVNGLAGSSEQSEYLKKGSQWWQQPC